MTTSQWSTDKKIVEAVHVAAYSKLVKIGILQPDENHSSQPWKIQEYMHCWEEFRASYSNISDWQAPGEVTRDFIIYCEKRWGRPNRHTAVMKVTAQVTRHYGDVTLTYGLEADYLVHEPGQLQYAFDELRSMVENQHELAQANRPELSPQKLKDHISANEEIILCTHVRKEFVDGKDRIRVIGGEYTKHGVAVYDEYMEKLGINPAALGYGDTPYAHHILIQVNGRGNPKRAIAIYTPTQPEIEE